ncbi:MAG: hypothetical protein IKT98_04730 [Selenomonadaceae bacterium]|nr:hypothetical protein [Selenomonadaceae bacterium]
MSKLIVGKSGKDILTVIEDKTQVYGLSGNDTIESNGKNSVTLLGGSGDDVLNMTGGNGILNGGNGADTFKFNYSAASKISAVIEDLDPNQDSFIINYNGNAPTLNYFVQNGDVLLYDSEGYLNITLKGTREANDYYDEAGNDNIWEVLRLVNEEREQQNLNPLVLSQGLCDGTAIRSREIINTYAHTRPDGSDCRSVLKKSYTYVGENIYSSPSSPEAAMEGWMNSPGHRSNILNSNYKKLGVGYTYDASSQWKYHWVQMFAGGLDDKETVSTDSLLNTATTLQASGSFVSSNGLKNICADDTSTLSGESISNDYSDTIINGTAYTDTIENFAGNVTIAGDAGNDSISNKLTKEYNFNTSKWEIVRTPDNVTINAGDGYDTVDNAGQNVFISAGANNDFVINGRYWEYERGGSQVSISGDAGNDTITSHGSNSLLDGGAGDDVIFNGYRYYESWNYFYDFDDENYKGNNVTISGGKGDDTIKNLGDNILIEYRAGDGNDYIEGFRADSTLSISGGFYSTTTSGNDVLVKVGTDKIVLKDAASLSKLNIVNGTGGGSTTPATTPSSSTTLIVTNSTKSPVTVGSSVKIINASKRTKAVKITGNAKANTIVGGSGKDTLYGGKGNDSIVGNASNDKLYGQKGNDTLYGGKGNDSLSGYSGNDKLYGGDNNDSILGGSGNDYLSGGSGADKLYGGSGKDTLWGGKGNDSLWGNTGADKFIYNKGDGKDIIYSFDNDDMLKITGAFSASYSKSKKEIYFKVGSTNKAITLKNFSATSFNVNGDSYKISGKTLK